MFKCLVLQKLYGLSDEEVEYLIADRRSFQKFLGMDIASDISDYATINNFRNLLEELELVGKLHAAFTRYLTEHGLCLRSGLIADATFVETPRRRCFREEEKQIKAGLSGKEAFPAASDNSLRHRDVDARRAVNNNERHFGYKNHALCDSQTKNTLSSKTTSAETHDSRMFLKMVPSTVSSEGQPVYADAAYDSNEIRETLLRRDYVPEINEKGRRNHPLTSEQKAENKRKSRVRCRIEHIFGDLKNRRKGLMIRTVGLEATRTKIGLLNLVYNMRRRLTLKANGLLS